ncbi:S8 family serine peptidase [bacterium]|nr:S8 family serine peptidase [bacterium]
MNINKLSCHRRTRSVVKAWGLSVVLLLNHNINTPAQELPPIPGGGGTTQPRDPTPEELAAMQKAREARWQSNLRRFQPYLIKTIDQLAGQSPVDGRFLSLEDLLWRRLEGGPSADDRKRAIDEREKKRNADSREFAIPLVTRNPDGRGTVFERIDESGRPVFRENQSLDSARTIQTDKVWPGGSLGLSLNGTNRSIAFWDTQHPYVYHPDFGTGIWARLSIGDPFSYPADVLTDHATRVAGILASAQGTGTPGSDSKGMAYGATIYGYDDQDDVDELRVVYTNSTSIRITSHNYAKIMGWHRLVVNHVYSWAWVGYTNLSQVEDPWFGRYDNLVSSNVDNVAFLQPYQLTVWAAGNEGITGSGQAPPNQPTNHYVWPGGYPYNSPQLVTNVTRPPDGDDGGYDTLPPEATAKNPIVVGSVTNMPNGYQGTNSVILSGFSSYGPTDAGLIKPDVVADGENVVSTIAPNTYSISSGTSYAGPSVAGSILLLRDHYLSTHTGKTNVLASTLKAIVLHTADEVGAPGPDFKHGWGLMNTAAGAQLISADALDGQHIREFILQAGSYIQWRVWVNSTNEPVKATIVWTDPAGTPPPYPLTIDPTNSVLENDLELRVFSPSGATNMPWALNPDLTGKSATLRSQPATKGEDHRNPVEQVFFWPTETGLYDLEITHTGSVLYGTNHTSLGYQMVSAVVTGNASEPQNEPLEILDFAQVSSNQVAFLFNSVPGGVYELLQNDNLSTTNWSMTGPYIGAAQPLTAFTNTFTGTLTNRFYQLLRTQ